ncbi:MAG: class I SAM-dependent methyltransferase [Planctomycetes bacterium]|jgi:SAM-dependent methyltransferase|nr:class I SAM-dependent methyltransferase [Planctomycetota bacterium]
MAPVRTCPVCSAVLGPGFVKTGLRYGVCAGCGGAFARRPPGEESRYRDYLPELTRTLPEATRRRYRELLSTFEPWRRTGRLLDVGCGSGFFVAEARAAGFEAEGTEVSAAAVEFAWGRGLPVHLGTLSRAGLPAGTFDVITLFEVVEHLPDPGGLVAEAAALLRPGGLLYLTTPNYGGLTRRLLGPAWSVIAPEHVSLFTPRSLRILLRRAGLAPVRIGSRNLLPHELARALRGRRPAAPGSSMGRTVEVQAAVEARPALRALKRIANAALSVTGLGDTLWGRCEPADTSRLREPGREPSPS